MPRDEPSWWYGAPGHVAGHVLTPLAWVYGAVAGGRLRQPAGERATLPVVCVGNFTAGGTGKTPLARWLGEALRGDGFEPVFLSRGYGGSRKGPHLVDTRRDHADDVGDEPLLLAGDGPAVIARDRAAGARFIAERRLGSVIIMDDGLQNPSLGKDLTIAVIDARRGIGNGRVIPAGPLRAPLADQLGVTDVIAINRGHAETGPDDQSAKDVAAIREVLRDFGGPVVEVGVAPADDLAWLRDKPALAYAGIANPDRFFDLLRARGGAVHTVRAFPDHHAFSDHDAAELMAQAADAGCQLVTTEKDFMRFGAESGALARLRQASRVLAIRLSASGDDADRLQAAVLGAVRRPDG